MCPSLPTMVGLKFLWPLLVVFSALLCEGSAEERTMIMIKPDGVERGLVGEIIHRIESKGLKLVAMKLIKGTEEQFRRTYPNIADKPFFPVFIKYMASGPIVTMVWEGRNAVLSLRATTGNTIPSEAKPGTIRSDLSMTTERNVIHSSSTVSAANSEIAFWFKTEELMTWNQTLSPWLFAP